MTNLYLKLILIFLLFSCYSIKPVNRKEVFFQKCSIIEKKTIPGARVSSHVFYNYYLELVILNEEISFDSVKINSFETSVPKIKKRGDNSISKEKTPFNTGDTLIISSGIRVQKNQDYLFENFKVNYSINGLKKEYIIDSLNNTKTIITP